MFRYSSSSSVQTLNPKSTPPPLSPAGAALSRPTEPLPPTGTRPHDILLNRCHEIKRISKSLASYFDGLASAHTSHAAVLTKLSAPSVITTPLPESSLFIPAAAPTSTKSGTPSSVGGGGWHELLVQTKETNRLVAEGHARLGKELEKNVVVPLKKIRGDMKAHISAMEKECGKLADAVLKERETSLTQLTSLTTSLSTSALPLSIISPSDDPVLLRSSTEAQLKVQIGRENELLAAVLSWTDKTEHKEKEVWREIARCWGIWEAANTTMLLGNQQRSMILSGEVDSVAPETEWLHFLKLNHTLASDTPQRDINVLEYPGQDDPLTLPLKTGSLERKTKFTRSWKSEFYVLTPTGHLHSYATSSIPLSSPNSSLPLKTYTLGPMPTPEASTKGRQLDALFTLETTEAGQSKVVLRAKSWEELSGWWIEIEKFTKPVVIPEITTIDAAHGGIQQETDTDVEEEATSPLDEPHPPYSAEEASHSAGDLGSSPNPAIKTPSGPPPPLPPRQPSTPEPHDGGGDIGFPSPRSPPILTEEPESPTGAGDMGVQRDSKGKGKVEE